MIAVLDTVSAIAFVVAAYYAIRIPARRGGLMEPGTRAGLIVAMALYAVVGVSNALEHVGITAAFDPIEDYIEVMFVPMIVFVAISSAGTTRLRQEQAAKRALREERDLSSSVLNASPAAILLVDADGTLAFLNHRAQEMIDGLGPGAAGEKVLARYGVDDPEPMSLADIAAEAPMESNLFVLCDGETESVVAVSADQMVRSDQVVVTLSDVTERVAAEVELEAYRRDLESLVERRTRQLVQMNAELEEANRAKRVFLANMSHELRTPLNSILGFSGVILQGLSGAISPEQRKQLEMIDRSGHQLLDLVSDVLDIARIEAGRARVEMGVCDTSTVLKDVGAEIRVLANKADVALEVDCSQDSFVTITDPIKLGQIVRNLASNAVKFTPPGGTVRLHGRAEDDELVFEVIDTGRGIAAEDQDRVFEAFYQAQSFGEVKSQGTGLGLAIVRELCDLIGAEVALESEAGVGTTFTVRVPRSAGPDESESAEV